MPSIKINRFDGIYSTADANDTKLELVRDSRDIKFENGYLKTETLGLAAYELPDLAFEEGTEGWEWETGIFGTVTNDPLAKNPVAAQHRVLLLVAKKLIGAEYHRHIWFKEYPSGQWFTTCNDTPRPYNTSYIKIKAIDRLITEIDGKVKIVNEEGAIKLYMPHDSFWFGRIERTLRFGTTHVINGYYFDRLIEPIGSRDTSLVPITGELPANRRLGVTTTISREEITLGADIEANIYVTSQVLQTRMVEIDGYLVEATDVVFRDSETGIYATSPEVKIVYRNQVNGTSDNDIGELLCANGSLFTFFKEYDENTGALTGYVVIPKEALNDMDISIINKDAIEANSACIHYQSAMSRAFFDTPVYKVLAVELDGYIWDTTDTITANDLADTSKWWNSLDNTVAYFAVTAMLDNLTEIIIATDTVFIPFPANANKNYYFNFQYQIPNNINKRFTRLRVYLKFDKELDYQKILDANVLEYGYKQTYGLKKTNLSGIYLSQNIGFALDDSKLENYKILSGLKDITKEKGYGIAISSSDYNNVYYCVVGGGKVMSDLFYTSNLINVSGLAFVNFLAGTRSGKVIVGTDRTAHVILIQEIDGSPVFEVIDAFPFGGESFKDVASIQGNVLINGVKGVYLTDGINSKLVSEAVIINNNTTTDIYYNVKKNELYLVEGVTPSNPDYLTRYRLDANKWERFNVPDLGLAREIMVDFDGNLALLRSYGLYTSTSATINANVEFNSSDLGEGDVDKLIDSIVPDYVGTGYIEFAYDNSAIAVFNLDSLSRVAPLMYITLQNRKPFSKLQMKIYSSDANFQFYGVKINFTVLRGRNV